MPASTRSAGSRAGCAPAYWRNSGCPAPCAPSRREFTTHGLTVRHHVPGDLPRLTEESELVVYRVAQEGLTNTARHAAADRAEVRLQPVTDGVELLVRDNGTGLGGAPEGAGIRGMRERALLIGAALTLGAAPGIRAPAYG